MSRWVYLCFLLLSGLLLGLALARKPPAPLQVGIIDADGLFRLDSELAALVELESEWEATNRLSLSSIRKRDADKDSSNLIQKAEGQRFRAGVENRLASMSSIHIKKSKNQRRRRYNVLRHGHGVLRDFVLRKAEKDLRLAYDAATAPDAGDSLSDEKFRLFNLKLKLNVLTRDPFVIPEYKLIAIRDEVTLIENILEATDEELADAMQDDFDARADELRAGLETTQAEIETDFELSVKGLLDETEQRLQRVLKEESLEMDKIVEAGLHARKMILKSASFPASATATPGVFFEDARATMKKEFTRRLRRGAPAVAERHGLRAIFNSPYPAPPGTIDVTDDFAMPFRR